MHAIDTTTIILYLSNTATLGLLVLLPYQMDHPYYLSARVALLFYETARDSLSSQRLRFPRVLILRTLPSAII